MKRAGSASRREQVIKATRTGLLEEVTREATLPV
jgi:hypothetical protein